ncbi:DNA ligase [Pleionea sediminis]|uniref:DNA ligase n=1 Tax=Pleionea sediminis TaxID=2569479 RepID=UPI001FE85181|nr:DNA ligase [Pleionea sediminis]
MRSVKQGLKFSLAILPLITSASATDGFPQLLLAKSYQPKSDLSRFWVSEKYDGVRAYWDGKAFYTRHGNLINAPKWFTESFPRKALDGELWIERGRFDDVSGIIRTEEPIDEEWKEVRFMVFDLPHSLKMFDARLKELEVVVNDVDVPHLQLVRHFKVANQKELDEKLDRIVAQGGEGLMLHRGDSLYQAKRTYDLQKLKPYDDAEAVVVAHFPGKGKYKGKLGAILVETDNGIRFKIGSGFSVDERENPPAVGSKITYRYRGKTSNDKPRFATFLRMYQQL